LIFILFCAPLVQAQECASIVQNALTFTDKVCSTTERNQACYGNLAIDAVPQDTAQNFKFDAPGDIVDVSAIQALNMSALAAPDEWGVALLSLQADLPDTLPGQNVTVLLFGGTTITNAGTPQAPTVNLSTDTTVNVRSSPGTSNRVVSKLQPKEALTADGQNAKGDWLRVRLADGSNGWVAISLVKVQGDATTLAVVDATTNAEGITYGPMQAFYFTSGVGTSNCAEAPQDGILIQTPEGAGKVNLLINEVSIELGSTAYVRAQKSGSMTFDLLEGSSSVQVGDAKVAILPGTRATIPLDAEGKASGAPTLTTIPDGALNGLDSVVKALPRDITITAPLTAAELDAAKNAGPTPGTWIIVNVSSTSEGCIVGVPAVVLPPLTTQLTLVNNGFTIKTDQLITMIGDGAGNFNAHIIVDSATTNDYALSLVTSDLMRGTMLVNLAGDGFKCAIVLNLEMTRQ